MVTNENYNVDLASLMDKKLLLKGNFANYLIDLSKERYFDVKATGNESTRDRKLTKMLKTPAIMSSGISTLFLPNDPN